MPLVCYLNSQQIGKVKAQHRAEGFNLGVVRLITLLAGGNLLNFLIEATGEKKKDKAAKVTAARRWIRTLGVHRGCRPWDAKNLIRTNGSLIHGQGRHLYAKDATKDKRSAY